MSLGVVSDSGFKLEEHFENIGRNFVHRNDQLSSNRYKNIVQLCDDIDALRKLLSSVDKEQPMQYSEYWLRLLNDLVGYLEEWPLSKEPEFCETAVITLNRFTPDILERSATFTQTQKTRFNSIAFRACMVTKDSVLSDVIDEFGETLAL